MTYIISLLQGIRERDAAKSAEVHLLQHYQTVLTVL